MMIAGENCEKKLIIQFSVLRFDLEAIFKE
jgi:hypothetical protein